VKKKMADKWKIMEESFYGDPRKKIKGAIHQLLDGDNAFATFRDMQMTGIMKRIENNTQLVKIRMSLWKELDEGEVKNTVMKYISGLLEKGEHLGRELEGMIAEGRNSNPIVNHLLFNAASSMGYKICGNDEVVGGKTSGEVLADYESS